MKPIRLPAFSYRFTLEGYNLERFVNTMSKENIPLLSFRRTGVRKLVCVCYQADMPAIQALVAEKGWKCTDPTPLGLAAFFAFLRIRWGIPLGFFLMIAVSVTLYQFVWQVEIRGAHQYHGDIVTYLADENLTPGLPKNRVDAHELTQKLNRRYPEVAWFNVYVHDVTLVVDCSLGMPPPAVKPVSPGDLVAMRDGVVTTVLVHAGTPAVKPGDIVRKGQVLVYGRERIADEGSISVNAQGVIMARCWRSQTVSVPLREVYSASTGRITEHQQICTPWLSVPAALETPSYLAYDTEITRLPLVGCFFPCWIQKTVFYEVALEFNQRNAEEVQAEAGTAATQKLLDTLRGNEIVDKWVDYCMIENDLMIATATAEWVMDIGSPALP